MTSNVLKGGDTPLTTLPKVGDYIVAPFHPHHFPGTKEFVSRKATWVVMKLSSPFSENKKDVAHGNVMPEPRYGGLGEMSIPGYGLTSALLTEPYYEETDSVRKARYIRLATKEERNAAILAQHEHMKAEKEGLTHRLNALEADMVDLVQDLWLELT